MNDSRRRIMFLGTAFIILLVNFMAGFFTRVGRTPATPRLQPLLHAAGMAVVVGLGLRYAWGFKMAWSAIGLVLFSALMAALLSVLYL
jgi:hypothetical protein